MKKSELRQIIREELEQLNTVNEELITEASSIPISDVPKDKLQLLKKVRTTPTEAWDGIHGTIIHGKVKAPSQATLTKKDLKTLLSSKDFRWVSMTQDTIKIGC